MKKLKYWVDGFQYIMTEEEATKLHHKLIDFEWFVYDASKLLNDKNVRPFIDRANKLMERYAKHG